MSSRWNAQPAMRQGDHPHSSCTTWTFVVVWTSGHLWIRQNVARRRIADIPLSITSEVCHRPYFQQSGQGKVYPTSLIFQPFPTEIIPFSPQPNAPSAKRKRRDGKTWSLFLFSRQLPQTPNGCILFSFHFLWLSRGTFGRFCDCCRQRDCASR